MLQFLPHSLFSECPRNQNDVLTACTMTSYLSLENSVTGPPQVQSSVLMILVIVGAQLVRMGP